MLTFPPTFLRESFSDFGPQISSIHTTWRSFRNATSQSRLTKSNAIGMVSRNVCFYKLSGCLIFSKAENNCCMTTGMGLPCYDSWKFTWLEQEVHGGGESENVSHSVVSNSLWPHGHTQRGHQAPLSMGFSRQEYRNGLSFPCPGDLPDPGIK